MKSVEISKKITIQLLEQANDVHWPTVIRFAISDILHILEDRHPLAFNDILKLFEINEES